jgi:hypothetical protein
VNQIKAIAGIEVKAKSKWLNALHVRGTAVTLYEVYFLCRAN